MKLGYRALLRNDERATRWRMTQQDARLVDGISIVLFGCFVWAAFLYMAAKALAN